MAVYKTVWSHEQSIGRNQVIIKTYESDEGGYSYSVQCRICGTIRAVFPHSIEERFPTSQSARNAAVRLLDGWFPDGSRRAALRAFHLNAEVQPGLFPELD